MPATTRTDSFSAWFDERERDTDRYMSDMTAYFDEHERQAWLRGQQMDAMLVQRGREADPHISAYFDRHDSAYFDRHDSAYFDRLERHADLDLGWMDGCLDELINQLNPLTDVSPAPAPTTTWSIAFFPDVLSMIPRPSRSAWARLYVGLLLGSAMPVMWLVFWKE
jgi:hypothetical protein